jgi:hypothetical protein
MQFAGFSHLFSCANDCTCIFGKIKWCHVKLVTNTISIPIYFRKFSQFHAQKIWNQNMVALHTYYFLHAECHQ